MRMFRTLLIVTIVLGALGVLSSGADATSGRPSPQFCSGYTKITRQLSQVRPTGSNYNAGALKKFGKGLADLAKSASGKLKSDIQTMASYFNVLGSQGSPQNAAKYFSTNSSVLKNYETAAADFVKAAISCETTTATTTTG